MPAEETPKKNAHCMCLMTLFVVVTIEDLYQNCREVVAESDNNVEELEAVGSPEGVANDVVVACVEFGRPAALAVHFESAATAFAVDAAGIAVAMNAAMPVLAAIVEGSFAESGKPVDQCCTSHCQWLEACICMVFPTSWQSLFE